MLNRLSLAALVLTAVACTGKQGADSNVAAVSSGITNFSVYIQAVDLDDTDAAAPDYLPEAEVNLLNGHSYELQAALYTQGIDGLEDGDLLWGSADGAAACLPIRTPVLTAADVSITIPLCHYDTTSDPEVDESQTATTRSVATTRVVGRPRLPTRRLTPRAAPP